MTADEQVSRAFARSPAFRRSSLDSPQGSHPEAAGRAKKEATTENTESTEGRLARGTRETRGSRPVGGTRFEACPPQPCHPRRWLWRPGAKAGTSEQGRASSIQHRASAARTPTTEHRRHSSFVIQVTPLPATQQFVKVQEVTSIRSQPASSPTSARQKPRREISAGGAAASGLASGPASGLTAFAIASSSLRM